jgi:hypothetical protein
VFDPGSPPKSDFTVRLTDAQVDEFHAQGFTHVDRITTDDELEWLAPLYDHLFETKGSFKGGYFDLARPYEAEGDDFVPQVLAPEYKFPQLRETTLFRNALGIGAQLLGVPEADVNAWSHMILKPPRVGGELPGHQDEAYWDTGMRYRALGCWVPLDPATIDSGCLHFVPGSHNEGVRDHRHINDDPNVHGLLTDGVDDGRGVPVPLEPGGASFHHCRTLHRSTPNTSGHVRRAWANELQLEPVPLAADETPDRPWVREGKEAWDNRSVYKR